MNKIKYLTKNKITKDSKIIIGIGDSFCAGTGSESFETWERNDWDVEKMRNDIPAQEEAYENSFINLLSKKYFTDYVSINLGMSGKGNIFAIRELLLNPKLNLEIAKEKIVIFVVSGLERFDFVKNIITTFNHSTTIWPYDLRKKNKIGYAEILDDDEQSIFNQKFVISEFMINFYNLINWCDLHNAKLLFINAFTPNINMYSFLNELTDNKNTKDDLINASKLVGKIPWHRQIKPLGFERITDMLLHLENRNDLMNDCEFRHFQVDKLSEYGYMSKCQHPTLKSQEILADIIYKQLIEYDNVNVTNFESISLDYLEKKYQNKII